MERRHPPDDRVLRPHQPTPLPHDYLKLVCAVFAEAFEGPLAELGAGGRPAVFEAQGELYADEVLLSVSLVAENQARALTVHASADFDVSEGTSAAEGVLAACVDAAASLFKNMLGGDLRIASFNALLEESPATWTPVHISGREVFLRADLSNPRLERMTEEWLAEHEGGAPDPEKHGGRKP
jgi:hypothetical protein